MNPTTTIELKTRQVFEQGTLETVAGNYVPARLFLDTIGALNSLLKVANANQEGSQEAQWILGHLNTVEGGNFVYQDLETHTGTFHYSITRDGKITEAARQIIQDVLKDDPSPENKGPEFSIDAGHYMAQLNEKAEPGHHFEIHAKLGVPVQVADAPEAPKAPKADETAPRTTDWVRAARAANAAKPGNNPN